MRDKALQMDEWIRKTDETVRVQSSNDEVATNTDTTKKYKGGNNPTMGFIAARTDIFNLNDKLYKVEKIISEQTGEAQLYLVENEGKHYVLKLYYPNFSPKLELLKILSGLNYKMIIELHDYGVITQGASQRTFELMEYLEGNTLDTYQLNLNEEQFKKIVLAASAALFVCHENGIIHKDIKPGNFFFRDKQQQELVLGDFGISSLCDDKEMLHRTTQARTPIYAAPELYSNVIDGEVELTTKIDFYSLGITLLQLWLGDNPFTGNERSMMRMKAAGNLPNLEQLPSSVNQLIRGLTVVNPENRWGFKEVERWYKGENVPVADNIPVLRYKTFIFDSDKNLTAGNTKEMAALLCHDKKTGVKYLYNKRIAKWLEDAGNQKLALEIDEIVEDYFPLNYAAGLTAAIYILNPEHPFMPDYPSSTPKEIVKAYSEKDCTEDDLKALTDGRLLLWLSNKNVPALYDEIQVLTDGQTFSTGLAYGVLYHLDRECGFELKEFSTPEQVAELLNKLLIDTQYITDDDFQSIMKDYLDEKGRLHFYSVARGWKDMSAFINSCLDVNSDKYEDRFGEYTLRIAAYKLCAGLGYTPSYLVREGNQYIRSLEELDALPREQAEWEIKEGTLKQWLSVFFHENPAGKFENEYDYERALEQYLYRIGKYDISDFFYARFLTAKELYLGRVEALKSVLRSARVSEGLWTSIFGVLCIALIFLLNHYGITNVELYRQYFYYSVCAPVAIMGVIMTFRWAFYRGQGFLLTLVSSLAGGCIFAFPALAAQWLMQQYTEETLLISVGLVLFYMLLALLFGFKESTLRFRSLNTLCRTDLKQSLIEPLYFAFKTTAPKFRGTNFGTLEDNVEVIRIARRGVVAHYVLLSLLVCGIIAIYFSFHPALMDMKIPDIPWEKIQENLNVEDYVNKLGGKQ